MRSVVLVMLSSVLFIGCAILDAPLPENPDYGDYPENYQEIINGYLRHNLKDPNSIQDLSISSPKKHQAQVSLSKWYFGYKVFFSYNAKNSYGGYVGIQKYRAIIRNGKIEGVRPWQN